MPPITRQQGSNFYNPQTGKFEGTVQYDAATGRPLMKNQVSIDPIPTAIPIDNLNTTINPAITPDPINPTNNAAYTTGVANTLQQTEAQNRADLAKANLDTSSDDIVKSLLELGNTSALENEAYQEQGVDTLKKTVDEYQGLLNGEKVALDDQIQNIEARSAGTFGGARERDLSAAQAKSSIRQNSILLKLSLATNSYATAKEIADREVESKLETQRAILEARKFIYENNKDLFDKADAERLKEEERAYQKSEMELASVSNLRLKLAENGAPLSVLNTLGEANTLEEALSIPGLTGYLTSPADKLDLELKRAQINSTNRANQPDGPSSVPQTTTYTLKSGDDPYNIAQNSGISVDQLKAANPGIKDWFNIKPGVTLKIPSGATGVAIYNGLDSKTATAVRSVVATAKSDPQVKTYTTIQDGYNFVKNLSNTTTNPSDDQALIYAFAKVMDPDSVVREGEYATVQKYAQSWAKAYGNKVSQAINGTGFLSPEARQNIKDTIENKYTTSKNTLGNVTAQYADQINSITGRNDGQNFLRDYSVSAIGTSTPANEPPVVTSYLNNNVIPALQKTYLETSNPINVYSSTFMRP